MKLLRLRGDNPSPLNRGFLKYTKLRLSVNSETAPRWAHDVHELCNPGAQKADKRPTLTVPPTWF